jgi:hypothetical protein
MTKIQYVPLLLETSSSLEYFVITVRDGYSILIYTLLILSMQCKSRKIICNTNA